MERRKILKKLRGYGLKNRVPNITDTNVKFLCDLIKIGKTKNMLEIGTANAFSTINFGMQLEKNNGKITSIEINKNSFIQAIENVRLAKLEETIKLINGDALDIIPGLRENYDILFIDAMKRNTKDFLEITWSKISVGGIIIIDDVIKFKEKMLNLYEFLQENKIDYNIIPLDKKIGISELETGVLKEEEVFNP